MITKLRSSLKVFDNFNKGHSKVFKFSINLHSTHCRNRWASALKLSYLNLKSIFGYGVGKKRLQCNLYAGLCPRIITTHWLDSFVILPQRGIKVSTLMDSVMTDTSPCAAHERKASIAIDSISTTLARSRSLLKKAWPVLWIRTPVSGVNLKAPSSPRSCSIYIGYVYRNWCCRSKNTNRAKSGSATTIVGVFSNFVVKTFPYLVHTWARFLNRMYHYKGISGQQ